MMVNNKQLATMKDAIPRGHCKGELENKILPLNKQVKLE
jgi:hypothetical protein